MNLSQSSNFPLTTRRKTFLALRRFLCPLFFVGTKIPALSGQILSKQSYIKHVYIPRIVHLHFKNNANRIVNKGQNIQK